MKSSTRRTTDGSGVQQSPVTSDADQPLRHAAIALGSNLDSALGSRLDHLQAALDALDDPPRTLPIARSAIHETPPVGPIPQGPYLNAAAILRTTLEPRALLARLLEIERSRGRDRAREQRWGPRTLDLDLLLFEQRTLDQDGLTIPHPRMTERLFVLLPLAEVAPHWPIPGTSGTVADALRALRQETR